jgi:glycoprotein endo-alpha-1,2-mannosidase
MKKVLIISIVFVVILGALGWLLNRCNYNFNNQISDNPLVGTWSYHAEDAPFGFQKGKVVFYEETDSVRAKLKIYGFTIPCNNLVVTEDQVSFSAWVETEEVAIQLEKQEEKMVGRVKASDLSSPLVLVKKGLRSRDAADEELRQESKTATASFVSKRKKTLAKGFKQGQDVNDRIHTFYYAWYGSPEFNDKYINWNHAVLPHHVDTIWNEKPPYGGGDDIGANFYPQLGCYSSIDTKVIETHMQQMKQAGTGVVALSWWGKKSYTDKSVSDILDIAHKHGLKIAFHIEPFYNKVKEFREQLKYISETYAHHPAMYKYEGKPFYYLYNSFKLKHHEWSSMLNPESETTIRNTKFDGVFISLWTTPFDGEFAIQSDFDGVYTYFVSDGFSYGSTTKNWPDMAGFAFQNNLIFIPCVGPGYIDTRIRPWNEKNTKERMKGNYYERMFKHAVNVKPEFIGITSFNEWHEGTQIEPAVPKEVAGFKYEDYSDVEDPYFYIKKSNELIQSLKNEL